MIAFFARHPTAANLFMLLFVVIGLASLPSLRRETFPDFSADLVQVTAVYPGASAEDVEEAVALRIEDAIDGINHVAEIKAEAREGLATVTVEMVEGQDVRIFQDDIRREVEAIADFPTDVEDLRIEQIGLESSVLSMAVTGEMRVQDLKSYCEALKRRLQRQSGVSLVSVEGFSDRQIQISLRSEVLQRFGLSVVAIADAVRDQNVDLPAGTIEGRDREFLVRFTDQRRTVREYQDLLVVAGDRRGEVRLGDIAKIEDSFDAAEDQFHIDGKRAGLLKVEMTKTQDALDVAAEVRAFFAVEDGRKPNGVEFIETQDMTSIVSDRLNMLTKNAVQGLVLVFLVMWLFFTLRLSWWVTLGLPVSFLGAFFFLPHLGMSINMLTMVALLLALGLLMDDAIVIAENVAARMRRGDKAEDAAIKGTMQVRNGVLASFTTTACVFVPLAFVAGDMGKVLRVIPIVLIAVLAISLVEAFWILPNHLSHSLHGHESDKLPKLRQRFESLIEWTRERVVGRGADLATSWRWLAVGLAGGVFALSIGWVAGGKVPFVPFPDVDGDVVQARVLLPQGTPLRRTQEVCAKLEVALLEVEALLRPRQPEGKSLIEQYSTQYNTNPDAKELGPHIATVTADLLSSEQRDATVDEIIALWRERSGPIADLISLQFKEPKLGPAGLPIELRLIGDDLAALKAASLDAQRWFRGFEGVFDVADDLRPGKPELRVRLREGALSLGMSARGVADQLRSSFQGRVASEIQLGPESYEIEVRLDAEELHGVGDLAYLRVTLPSGKQAPLASIATVEQDRGWARIARIDGVRTVTVTGDLDTRVANAAAIMGQFKRDEVTALESRHPGVRVSLEGQARETTITQQSMMRGMLFGLIGVFMLLCLQFRSWIEPLVVMAAIPMCLIGVIWGHAAMGLPLTIPSMFGFVSLAGIVVNDSILLVEFIKLRRREGMPLIDACRQASRDRFRAVLLTSLTTIAGLSPLLLEKSMQAQFLIPLAASIVFGMLASTLMILFLVPATYALFGEFGWLRQETAEPE